MIYRRRLYILLFILILAFALRIYRLGGFSLWHDEALTAAKAKIPFSRIPQAIVLTGEENPPGYFFLINGWSKLFGKSEFSLRFPSLIFSVFSVLLIYLLGKNLFSEKAGLGAAFLAAISSYNINYAQEARPYSLLWFLGAASLLAFVSFLRRGKTPPLIFCVFINALAFYVSYAGGLYILSQNAIFFILYNRRLSKKWVFAQIVSLGLILPGLLSIIKSIVHSASTLNWRGSGVDYIDLLRRLLCYFSGSLKGEYATAAIILFTFLIIVGCVTYAKSGLKISLNRNDLIVWGWFFIPLIAAYLYNSLSTPLLAPGTVRYVGFIHIPFLLAAAKGLSKLNRVFLTAALVLISAFIFSRQLLPYYTDNGKIGFENWRDLIAQLDREATEDDLIICPGGMIHSYRYYHRSPPLKAIWVSDLKEATIEAGSGSIFVLYRQWKEKESYKNLAGYRRIGHFQRGNIGMYQFRK